MVEPHCLWDPDYEENPKRFSGILDRVKELGLDVRCERVESRPATETEILSIHSKEYFELVKSTKDVTDEKQLEELSSKYDAIYFHPQVMSYLLVQLAVNLSLTSTIDKTFDLSLLSAGSVIELVNAITEDRVKNGFALVRPPGHHAMKSEACGYCYFNNVAIAAKHAVTNLGLERVLIVDWVWYSFS